ncbi:excalibur calcium-binding domain-containing protein [Streptomyces sp. SID1034]|uniref:excalibur calcium-binding domain-containing protein n=1 Tax=Streptomyces sp. SID1034 TaxID=2690248 RepID=UPI00136BA6BD|nr:excalibur calcium-binding domain-containing protein [Streptomyces sp. SID1034]MYV89426.1 calcium-binding protein [Streptomyces sp. SID1034]
MRISRPAVRTLLISGLLGAVALTTAGCQDDAAKPAKPAASSPAATPTQSATPSSPSPTGSRSASATPTHSATPAAPPVAATKAPVPKAPPKPRMTAPVPPPPMNGGGNKGGGSKAGGAVYYKNCTAARAAGVTPLHRGDPGYDSHLDRDGDGVACER